MAKPMILTPLYPQEQGGEDAAKEREALAEAMRQRLANGPLKQARAKREAEKR